uniref:Ribosomal protein S20 n=1 Tax=Rhodogorgon sp. TaxID=2485824 RepID=A0A3G3MI55_9FLOR|nr:ribosomal protein S20 [Rhodogorgon sp.]
MSKNSSIIKRIHVASRNRLRNKTHKSSVKTIVNKFLGGISFADTADIKQMQLYLAEAYSKIDKAVKKGVLHKNCGARKKSFLAKTINKRILQQ